MTPYEMRAYEAACETILATPYWAASKEDIDQFINDIRKHIFLKVQIVAEKDVDDSLPEYPKTFAPEPKPTWRATKREKAVGEVEVVGAMI